MTDRDDEARLLVATGITPDEVARQLVARGSGPIAAVKALRAVGVPLGDGKLLVDAVLPARERAANERLRDELLRIIEDDL